MTKTNKKRRQDSIFAYIGGILLFVLTTSIFLYSAINKIVIGHYYYNIRLYIGCIFVLAWFIASCAAIWLARKKNPNQVRFVFSFTMISWLFSSLLLGVWLQLGTILAWIVFTTASASMLFVMTRLTIERIHGDKVESHVITETK